MNFLGQFNADVTNIFLDLKIYSVEALGFFIIE